MATKPAAKSKDAKPAAPVATSAPKKQIDPETVNSLSRFKAANDSLAARGDTGWSVHWAAIKEEPGYNERDYDSPESKQHIRLMADAYKRGEKLPRLVIVVRRNQILVRDGHHRIRAIALAVAEGAQIEKVQVDEFVGDEIEQALIPLKTQSQLALTFLQLAAHYQKFRNWGWSDEKIGASRNPPLSGERVRQTIELLTLPVALKELIKAGNIKASTALKLYKEHGGKATEMVSTALEAETRLRAAQEKKQREAGLAALGAPAELELNGSDDASPVTQQGDEPAAEKEPIKISPKHVAKHSPTARQSQPRISKQVVEWMTRGVRNITARLDDVKVENDRYLVPLSKEEYEEFVELRQQMALASGDAGGEHAKPKSTDKDQLPLLDS